MPSVLREALFPKRRSYRCRPLPARRAGFCYRVAGAERWVRPPEAMREKATSPSRRAGALGVHSLDRFVFSVPDLDPAERFYRAFGLEPRRDGNRLDLVAAGGSHCWGSLHADGEAKRLRFLRFGAWEDEDRKST